MTEEGTSHDKLFKAVFRTFLKDLLELVSPELVSPELATTLDFDHPGF